MTNQIATRTATPEEQAETNAFQSDTLALGKTLQERASNASLAALDKVDEWTRKAVSKLALVLCAEQVKELLTDQVYKAETDAFVFRNVILMPAALAGRKLYENTADEAAAIKAAAPNSSDRKKLAKEYVMRKMTKDTGYVSGIKAQRTNGFRLAAYARDNMGAEIVNVARMSTTDVVAAEKAWEAALVARFGTTWDEMASKLKAYADAKSASKPKAASKAGKAETITAEERKAQDDAFARMANDAAKRAAEDANPVAVIMERVADLSGPQFEELLYRMAAEHKLRQARAAHHAPKAEPKAEPQTAPVIALPARRAA